MEGGGIYFFVPPFFCVWPIFMPYFFVWQIKIFSTVAWQNVRAANRTKNFEKGQQKRNFSRAKKKPCLDDRDADSPLDKDRDTIPGPEE